MNFVSQNSLHLTKINISEIPLRFLEKRVRENIDANLFSSNLFYLYVDIIKDIYISKTEYVLMRKDRGRSFDSCPMRKFSYKRFLSSDLFSPAGPRNEIGKVDFINDHTGTWNAHVPSRYIHHPANDRSIVYQTSPRRRHAAATYRKIRRPIRREYSRNTSGQ